MYYLVMLALGFLLLLNSTMTSLLTLGYFDGNSLETYEDVSDEQNDTDVFGNLTFRFSCENRPSGFYADVDYNCRIFHVCDNSSDGFPVICANDTVFDQRRRICTDEESIDCQNSYEWYYLNELTHPAEIVEDDESEVIQEDAVPSVLPLFII